MSVRPEVLGLILASMAVTIVPRVLPLLGAHRMRMPGPVAAWLSYVPVAVISALFFNEILLAGGHLPRQPDDPHLLAGVLTLAIAFLSRSIAITVIVGVLLFAGLQAVVAGT